jgi:hypothetical protein
VRNARERYLLGDHRGHAQGRSLVPLYAESENNYSSFMLPLGLCCSAHWSAHLRHSKD